MTIEALDLEAPYRTLVSSDLWTQLTGHLQRSNPHLSADTADRAMDQALAFLLLIANEGGAHAPSHVVDLAWHSFVLHTREYASFCERIAGRFIHHNPESVLTPTNGSDHLLTPIALLAAGLRVDSEMWSDVAECNSYCSGDSCSGSQCNGS